MKIKNRGLSIVLAMVVLAIAIPSVSSTTPATPEDVSPNTLATVPTVTITDAHLSTSSTGAPVTTFTRGQTIYFVVKYTLSAPGNVARVYSNIDWPTTVPGTLWATTTSQPAGTYSFYTTFATSTSIPAGAHTALIEVAVSGGNLKYKTITYKLT